MKYLLIIGCAVLFYSCTSAIGQSNGRIKFMYRNTQDRPGLSIVEVDGKEYLVNNSGGIIMLG